MLINGNDINLGTIRTNENCIGCNRCIRGCPVFCANAAIEEDGRNRVYVDQDRCISCGRCMDMCEHDARVFVDDTDSFLEDLRAGEKEITLIVAPSFMINYPNKYNRVLGYLRHIGARAIYSVSAGADIAVWAYLNYFKEHDHKGMLSQPCPAIVNYVEKYHTDLLDKLMPIQSPALCTSIYLRKYLGLKGEIAFLSPCIAKKGEIDRSEHAGQIQYNVTFSHLVRALSDVDITPFYADDSLIDYGVGALFPVQGGLSKNIEYYFGDGIFVNQKGGEAHAYSYLDLYSANIHHDDPYRAKLIEILNCSRGCVYGTATEFKHTASNHIPFCANQMRMKKSRQRKETGELMTPPERFAALNERFAGLNRSDFTARYVPQEQVLPSVCKTDIRRVFRQMLKYSEAECNVDCANCGYNTCKEMATAIALGYNYRENCTKYVKKKLVITHSESMLHRQQLENLQRSRIGEKGANIDQLTGLPNRYVFEHRLAKLLKSVRKNGHICYLFNINLDDFMTINESYGHNFGNAILVEFGSYLEGRFGDEGEIFRTGGDDFVLLLEDANDTYAQSVSDAILRRVQNAWEVMGTRVYCTVSVGAVRFPEVDDGFNDIIRNADHAVHRAKLLGKNNCVLYDRGFESNTHEQVNMIRQMRDDVAAGFADFELRFQPWMHNGKIIGAEVLLRWKDDSGAYVSPDVFIPVAENTGLIIPIGEFVLRVAAQECVKINRVQSDFLVSINVSVRQFSKPDIVELFMQIIKEAGVNPHNIVLEITESLGIENIARQKLIFGKFVENGVRIALDDFGTGYSSLSYLNELPLDLVKIDRAFIRNIETDVYSRYLLDTMADLMHRTDRRICVEGVETENQMEHCQQSGIDIMQGFYYYKPMMINELTNLIVHQEDTAGGICTGIGQADNGCRRPIEAY